MKQMNNKIENKKYMRKNQLYFNQNKSITHRFLFILLLYIFLHRAYSLSNKDINTIRNLNKILNKESSIIINIEQKGKHRIFYKGDNKDCAGQNNEPSKIIINTNEYTMERSQIEEEYDFQSENNIIKIIFPDLLLSFKCLFYGCSNLTKIDVRNLDTS